MNPYEIVQMVEVLPVGWSSVVLVMAGVAFVTSLLKDLIVAILGTKQKALDAMVDSLMKHEGFKEISELPGTIDSLKGDLYDLTINYGAVEGNVLRLERCVEDRFRQSEVRFMIFEKDQNCISETLLRNDVAKMYALLMAQEPMDTNLFEVFTKTCELCRKRGMNGVIETYSETIKARWKSQSLGRGLGLARGVEGGGLVNNSRFSK